MLYRKQVIYKTEEGNFAQLVGYANDAPIFKNLSEDKFFIPTGKCEIVAKDISTFFEFVGRIFTPTADDASNWTIARWKAEIFILGQRTFDRLDTVVFEKHLDWVQDKSEISAITKKLALEEIQDSEYFKSGSAKERALEHTPSLIDLSPTDINKYHKGKTNDWKNLRDATFYAAMVKDVVRDVGKRIKREIEEEIETIS